MEWILFSMLAAALFAAANFVDKFASDNQTAGVWDFIFSYGLINWFFVLGFFLGLGVPDVNQYFYLGILSGGLVALTGFFYVRAIQVGEVSKLVILFQIIPLVSVLVAWIFLNQALSPLSWLAFVLVLVGGTVALLDRTPDKGVFSKGALDMVMFSVVWGIVFVITDYLLQFMDLWNYLYLQTLGLSLANLPLLLISKARKEVFENIFKNKGKFISFSINNVMDMLGKMAIVYALVVASSVGLVTVMLQTQTIFSILFGAVLTIFLPHLFKEDVSLKNMTQKILGAIIIFVGIVILQLF